MESSSYLSRLLRRAWSETKDYWSLNRCWTTIAPTLVMFVILATAIGWHALMDSKIIFAAVGVAAAFGGTPLLNLIRSTKLLDDDRQKVADTANATIDNLTNKVAELEAPQRTAQQEHYYQEARAAVDNLADDEKEVLREIIKHGCLVGGRVGQIYNINHDRVQQILNGNALRLLVQTEEFNDPGLGLRKKWAIVRAYEKALAELLYPISS